MNGIKFIYRGIAKQQFSYTFLSAKAWRDLTNNWGKKKKKRYPIIAAEVREEQVSFMSDPTHLISIP